MDIQLDDSPTNWFVIDSTIIKRVQCKVHLRAPLLPWQVYWVCNPPNWILTPFYLYTTFESLIHPFISIISPYPLSHWMSISCNRTQWRRLNSCSQSQIVEKKLGCCSLLGKKWKFTGIKREDRKIEAWKLGAYGSSKGFKSHYILLIEEEISTICRLQNILKGSSTS